MYHRVIQTFAVVALLAAGMLPETAAAQVRGPLFVDRCGLNSGVIGRDLAIASKKARQQREAESWSTGFLALEVGLLGGAFLATDDEDLEAAGVGLLAGAGLVAGLSIYSAIAESDAEKFARSFETACRTAKKDAALTGYADLGRLAETARERRQTGGLLFGVMGLGLGVLMGIAHANVSEPTEASTLMAFGGAYASSLSLVAMGWHFAFRVQDPDELLFDSYRGK